MSAEADWLYHDHLDLEDLLNDCTAAVRRREWEADRFFLCNFLAQFQRT